MRRLEAASFSCQWKRKLGWRRGTRVVVLFEHRWDWERLPETFREKFIWHYDVLYMEIDTVGEAIWQMPECLQKYLELLQGMQPEGLAGIGGFAFLQWVVLLRERLGGKRIPMLLFSGRDRWWAFFREMLWVRGENGRTAYWGYVEGHKKDALVMVAGGEFRDALPDDFEKEMERLWNAMAEYDICEELAEPLRILYGIPMEAGGYFALKYLYRQRTEREREEIGKRLGNVEGHLDWRLERLAHQYRRLEVTSVLLSGRDIPLLTEMAMEAIENCQLEWQASWRFVEGFYRELCQGNRPALHFSSNPL